MLLLSFYCYKIWSHRLNPGPVFVNCIFDFYLILLLSFLCEDKDLMTDQLPWPPCFMTWDFVFSVFLGHPLQNKENPTNSCICFVFIYLFIFNYRYVCMSVCGYVHVSAFLPRLKVDFQSTGTGAIPSYEPLNVSSGNQTHIFWTSHWAVYTDAWLSWLTVLFSFGKFSFCILTVNTIYIRPRWNYIYSEALYWVYIRMYLYMYVIVENPMMTPWILPHVSYMCSSLFDGRN